MGIQWWCAGGCWFIVAQRISPKLLVVFHESCWFFANSLNENRQFLENLQKPRIPGFLNFEIIQKTGSGSYVILNFVLKKKPEPEITYFFSSIFAIHHACG
jgi:hypothetical protein